MRDSPFGAMTSSAEAPLAEAAGYLVRHLATGRIGRFHGCAGAPKQ